MREKSNLLLLPLDSTAVALHAEKWFKCMASNISFTAANWILVLFRFWKKHSVKWRGMVAFEMYYPIICIEKWSKLTDNQRQIAGVWYPHTSVSLGSTVIINAPLQHRNVSRSHLTKNKKRLLRQQKETRKQKRKICYIHLQSCKFF